MAKAGSAAKAWSERVARWELVLENAGDLAVEDLRLVAEPGDGLFWTGGQASLEAHVPKLEVGESRPLEILFTGQEPGRRVLRASVRDGRGWVAAGCAQIVVVEPADRPTSFGAPVSTKP